MELPSIIGCPGCDDGPIGTLTVFTETDFYAIKFEGLKPPKAIEGITGLITAGIFKE
ncbi:hypothetical protein [Kriegella aquimaris]|uniref:Uncharacterized protein n=1 Tax=Kriegella aquimaris TaxID=192904 RepID=A0A1G9WX70_9FLAO|nr:hypothetical protein [Kriegella aquimaris]SDM89092.1 hypothetical protein SAMN04488514_11698 [Kriegella aquimaris]